MGFGSLQCEAFTSSLNWKSEAAPACKSPHHLVMRLTCQLDRVLKDHRHLEPAASMSVVLQRASVVNGLAAVTMRHAMHRLAGEHSGGGAHSVSGQDCRPMPSTAQPAGSLGRQAVSPKAILLRSG